MMRPIFNILLAIGYLMGIVLVWIGVEMFAVDGARLAPSLLSVSVGIAVWWVLASFGRRMRVQTPSVAECKP
jgi:hypothetical protein